MPKITENSSIRLGTEQNRTEKLTEKGGKLPEKLPEKVDVIENVTDTSQIRHRKSLTCRVGPD